MSRTLCILATIGFMACGAADERPDGSGGGEAAAELEVPSRDEASGPPNILLVTIDTLRADHVGAYGYSRDTTPELDRLAANGTLFETVYAPTGATCPSHATLFTARSPMAHGVLRNGYVLGQAEQTLAERLAGAGWQTAAFVSSYPLAKRFGFAQGFAHYDDRFDGEPTFVTELWEGKPFSGTFDRPGGATVDRAVAWLAAAPGDPVFVWVHLFDPHAPYQAPSADADRYTRWTDDERARDVAQYDGEVRYADAQLGRLVRAFSERSSNNLVVVASDHGEGLYDHGWRTHNRGLYEEEVRVPWVLHWPGRIPSGRRVATPAHLADLGPTLLGLLEAEAWPTPHAGRDLADAIRGDTAVAASAGPADTRSLWLQRAFYGRGRPSLGERGWQLGVRRGRWKYLEAPGEGRRELYDLSQDGQETRNLAGQQPDVVRDLSRRLSRWRARELDQRTPEEQQVSEEDQQGLEALGYLE